MEKSKSGNGKPSMGSKSYPCASNAGAAKLSGGVRPSSGTAGKPGTKSGGTGKC